MRRTAARALALPAALALLLVGCGDDEGDAQAFCNIADNEDLDAFGGDDPDAVRDTLQELRDTAPGEIRDDVVAVVDPLEEMLEELEGLEDSDDPEAAMEALTRLEEEIDEDAAERVETWVDENC